MEISAIVLTGGRSSRFGSDKTTALLGQKPLVNHLLDSIPDQWPIVIVGPAFEYFRRSLQFTREEPVGGGPVCAVNAGLQMISTEFVVVIAADMPFAGRLLKEFSMRVVNRDGLVALDDEGIPQSLCALYRVAPLRTALKAVQAQGGLDGQSMKNLIGLLDIEEISLGKEFASSLLDIDTPEDLERLNSEE